MNRPLLGLLVAAAVSVGVYLLLSPPPFEPPARDANCRQLTADPTEYVGHRVRVSLDGCERYGAELHWRAMASQPPAVILRFAGPVPDPLPRHCVGECRVADRVILVIGCRAAD